MMKPALAAILHSSFNLLNSPVTASHYVKVMLDQIFGENSWYEQRASLLSCISIWRGVKISPKITIAVRMKQPEP